MSRNADPTLPPNGFFGWRVAWGAFVLAILGWGLGFYGPPIYLHQVVARTGWSVGFVSACVTLHYLLGAVVVANLPRIHRRLGVAPTTWAASLVVSSGVLGWALAETPWQLALAASLSGIGWVGMSAAALNAIVSPWFDRDRPSALSTAYNGASVGGILLPPLWVALIAGIGFPAAAGAIGLAVAATVGLLSWRLFAATPESVGQPVDGGQRPARGRDGARPAPVRGPLGRGLWRDGGFLTLAAAMTLGLFAQVGLLAHLFSVLVPALGEAWAGWALSAATLAAILGRSLGVRLIGRGVDRRMVAAGSYAVQTLGSLVLWLAGDGRPETLWLGTVLIGAGIGNATSLPPLIAQTAFHPSEVQRVVALIVAIGQAGYAFAPILFGLLREAAPGPGSIFATAAAVQALAILACLLGRRTGARPETVPTSDA